MKIRFRKKLRVTLYKIWESVERFELDRDLRVFSIIAVGETKKFDEISQEEWLGKREAYIKKKCRTGILKGKKQ